MITPIRTVLFALVMLGYLWVPFSMIRQQETILEEGTTFLFRTEPVDPYDAFRGKYVALSLLENTITKTSDMPDVKNGETVYLTVATDDLGYAFFSKLELTPPTDHSNYIKTKIGYIDQDKIFIGTPENLQRYYLNEKLAPLVETAYRNMSRQQDLKEPASAHLKVSVLNGEVVLDELFLKQMSVEDYLEGMGEEVN